MLSSLMSSMSEAAQAAQQMLGGAADGESGGGGGGGGKAAAAAGAEGADAIVVAAGTSSDGSADSAPEDVAALAEQELEALSLANGGEGLMDEVRAALLQPAKLSKYIGMDVTGLMSVPLFIMEPFTMLQKMAEIMEYSSLLDAADEADDELERLALVAAFLVSPFGAAERAWKPFNSLLGETFELHGAGRDGDARFVAEQVAVNPDVSVAHAENARWAYDIVSAPSTRFLGNALEVYPKGRTRITLRRSGDTYVHVPPSAKVHNLVIGKAWVDTFGTFLVESLASGAKVVLDFKACGWFGAGQHEFDGHVIDARGVKRMYLDGLWHSHLDMQPCGADGAPAVGGGKRRLWTCAPKPADDAFGCTAFARRLNTAELLRRPPRPSDSRRRPDRLALDERRMQDAAAEKRALEEEARLERKAREEGGGGEGKAFAPRWFEPAPDTQLHACEEPADVVPLWRFNGRFDGDGDGGSSSDAAAGGDESWRDTVMGQGFVPWMFRKTPVASGRSSNSSGSGNAA